MTNSSLKARDELAKIEDAVARADRNLAIDLAIAALGRGIDPPLVLRLVAEGLEQDGRPADALGLLNQATTAAPLDAEGWGQFGRVLASRGRFPEALAALENALAIDPNAYSTLIAAGTASFRCANSEAAARHYRRAAEVAPGEAEPLSALAVIASLRDEPKEARAMAERALVLRPDLVSPHVAIGRADLLEDAADACEARMTRLLGRGDVNCEQREDALDLRANARDVLDHPAEAFADYQVRNVLIEATSAPRIEAEIGERRVDQAVRLVAYFEAASAAPWRERAGRDLEGAAAAQGHVFLLGFPRSGTTLLERVLASHPGVATLEETDHLAEAGGHFLGDDEALGRLSTLTAVEATACRQTYWRGVREWFGEPVTDKILVDKLPLYTPALPLIAKLFPDAKILFALRDPRDVVLSCFRRRFRMNAGMFEFLTLEGAARYYDRIMTLADIYRAKLALSLREVRHEAVVADFEGEVREILAFIGADWDPAVRAFADRARQSRTPSARQLAGGLNARGVGQWRRYQAQLSPVLPLLEPWAARFGYAPVDPAALPGAVDPRVGDIVSQVDAAVRAGDWTVAFSLVDAAFAEGLRHQMFFRVRGVRAQREGRIVEAIADFETALRFAPGDFAVLSALGLCLARSGRHAEGLASLGAAIAINPLFAPAHYNRGWTLQAMGDLDRAAGAYRRAVELDPRHAQALGNLAALAAHAADWTQARRLAVRALEIDPSQAVAAAALAAAQVAEDAGQTRETF